MTVYQIVTERIIHALEKGVIPWRKPWKVAGHPKNFITCKPYRGINILLLAMQCYSSPYWLTYKQASERGGYVKKGEKATPIVFWKVEHKSMQDGEQANFDRLFMLRYYNVFNLEQTTLAPAEQTPLQPLASCSAVVDAWQQKPRLIVDDPKVSQAEYFPKLDAIAMPLMSRFHSAEYYYATLFHELIHSTGHASRLNREGIANFDRFGSERYSKEELVAEIGSAFLCAHTGISKPELETNTTAYLQSWIETLKGDSRLIVSAAAQAQRAVDMVLDTHSEEQTQEHGNGSHPHATSPTPGAFRLATFDTSQAPASKTGALLLSWFRYNFAIEMQFNKSQIIQVLTIAQGALIIVTGLALVGPLRTATEKYRIDLFLAGYRHTNGSAIMCLVLLDALPAVIVRLAISWGLFWLIRKERELAIHSHPTVTSYPQLAISTKRILGLLLFVALIGLVLALPAWKSPSQPVQSWNAEAIKARFVRASASSAAGTLSVTFTFDLHNSTESDYKLDQVPTANAFVMQKLKSSDALLNGIGLTWSPKYGPGSSELNDREPAHQATLIPAGQTVRVVFCCSQVVIEDSSSSDNFKVAEILPEIDSFILFDSSSRFRIELPIRDAIVNVDTRIVNPEEVFGATDSKDAIKSNRSSKHKR